MTDATGEFLDRLGREGRVALLDKAVGTLRLDLAHGEATEHWVIAMKKGDVAVSRKKVAADCVVHADRALFDHIVAGKANAFAALLRGLMVVEGNPELFIVLQRLFPGPQDSREPTETASTEDGSR